MNAGGRVPCRCGVTLVLEPPREPRAQAGDVARESADIARLGYTISVERARSFSYWAVIACANATSSTATSSS